MRRSYKILLLLSSSVLWAFALTLGGEALVFLAYASLLFWVVPLLHGLAGLLFLRVTISMPARTVVCGETLAVSYKLQNKSIFSFPSVELQSSITGNPIFGETKAMSFSLSGKESIQWDAGFETRRRGVYKTGSVRMTVKNIYGIGEFSKVFSGSLSLTVYPRILRLRSLAVGATRQSGELVVTDPLCRSPNELSDLGFWKPGDSLKHIHWKASARSGQWLVKNYEMRGDSEVTVVIDGCSADYPHDPGRILEDSVVSLAASVLDYLLCRSIDATLILLGPTTEKKIHGSSEADIPSFLDALAGFSPTSGSLGLATPGFAGLLASAVFSVRDGSSVFVIAPRLDKSLAIQGMQLQLSNRRPKFIIVAKDGKRDPGYEKSAFSASALSSEGIPVQFVDYGEDIREALG